MTNQNYLSLVFCKSDWLISQFNNVLGQSSTDLKWKGITEGEYVTRKEEGEYNMRRECVSRNADTDLKSPT